MDQDERLKNLLGLINLLQYASKEAQNLDQEFITYLLSMAESETQDKFNELNLKSMEN